MPSRNSIHSVPAQHSARRKLSVLAPCIFTVGRICCGFFVIIATFRAVQDFAGAATAAWALARFDNATKAIGLALVFDILDGSVSRLLGSASNLGVELDSLADVVAFGMPSAVLVFFWGVDLIPLGGNVLLHDVFMVAAGLVGCLFITAAVFRLARFNLQALAPDDSDQRFFVGLPVPAAAAVIAAVIHFLKHPLRLPGVGLMWLVLTSVLALLMVSRIRYETSGLVPVRFRTPYFWLPFLALFACALWFYSELVILVTVLGFVVSGPLGYAGSRRRRFERGSLSSGDEQDEHGNTFRA